EPIADIGRALDHAPADAKGQTRFVLSLYSPGKCDRFPALALDDGHRADRTHFRRGGFGLGSAGRQHPRRQASKRKTRTDGMPEDRWHYACQVGCLGEPPLYTKPKPFVGRSGAYHANNIGETKCRASEPLSGATAEHAAGPIPPGRWYLNQTLDRSCCSGIRIRLEGRGHDALRARTLLEQFEEMQEMHISHRDRLLRRA